MFLISSTNSHSAFDLNEDLQMFEVFCIPVGFLVPGRSGPTAGLGVCDAPATKRTRFLIGRSVFVFRFGFLFPGRNGPTAGFGRATPRKPKELVSQNNFTDGCQKHQNESVWRKEKKTKNKKKLERDLLCHFPNGSN
jgi:hypothetical protein